MEFLGEDHATIKSPSLKMLALSAALLPPITAFHAPRVAGLSRGTASWSAAMGRAIWDALGGQDSIENGAFSPRGSHWLPRQ